MMPNSLLHEGTLEALMRLARGAPPGDFAEFGVYKGGSAARLAEIARAQGRRLFLFDTFSGIPVKSEIDGHNVGDFNDTSLDSVFAAIPDAIFFPGVFPATLLATKVAVERLAFVHVDADQYESVKAACLHFPDRMVRGGIMLFDDYKCLDGATLAIEEWGEPISLTEQGKAVWRKP
jgi:O-methyltransferase